MGKLPPPEIRYPNRWRTPWRRALAHIQLALWRIQNSLKEFISPEVVVSLPPPKDPASEFTNPGNQELFEYLKRQSRLVTPDMRPMWNFDGYELHCHPDLMEFLYDMAPAKDVTKGRAYGLPVLANPQKLIFAWAGGTHSLMFRLGPEHRIAASQDNGRFDPTYGKDWMQFRFGGLRGGPTDWRSSIQRWISVAHQESLR